MQKVYNIKYEDPINFPEFKHPPILYFVVVRADPLWSHFSLEELSSIQYAWNGKLYYHFTRRFWLLHKLLEDIVETMVEVFKSNKSLDEFSNLEFLLLSTNAPS